MNDEIKKEELQEHKNDVAVKQDRTADLSLGTFGSTDNFTLAWQAAQALSKSTLVPANFQGKPENVLIAVEQAQRLNVSPFMVMQNLYVIQGRPSWSSKFLIAMINGSGKFDEELHFDEKTDKNGKPFSCLAWTVKDGRRIDGVEVNMDMAQVEGWLTKNGSKWKTLPALMLRYRAASFFANLNCPELTLGMYTKEEVEDNNFMEYPVDAKEQAAQDIAENANKEEFVDIIEADGKVTEVATEPAEPLDNEGNPIFK